MLVMLVIGVMVGMAALALGNNPARTLDKEARRLQALLNMASEEAITHGVELTLALSTVNQQEQRSYQLLLLDTEELQWIAPGEELSGTELFARHAIEEDILWDLELEGEQLSDAELEQIGTVLDFKTPDKLRPAILLLSSGEITPFRLELGHLDTDYRVRLQSDGISGVFLR